MTIEERVAALETSAKDTLRELSEIKTEIKDLRDLTSAVKGLTVSIQAMSEKVDKIDTRLESVEREPADDFRHYKRLAIGGLITGVIGILFALITTLVK